MQESENLEFKSSFSEWKEIIISLVAFANTKGGKVIIGLSDDGEPTQINIGKSTLEDFVNKVSHNTDPTLYPAVTVKTFGPSEVVEVEIKESDYKPVFAFGRVYRRISKTNQKLSATEIKNLIQKYQLPDFDSLPVLFPFDQISWDMAAINKLSQDFPKKERTPKLILKKLGFILNGHITNGAYLCFVERNELFHSAKVKVARFKGTTTSAFLDMKEFDSNLISMVNEVIEFIQRHISMKVTLNGTSKRQEQWEYPMIAIREAVVNALVHRDYTDPGQIQVRLFDDRLEIISPGLLPKEITPESIEGEMRSIPRNRILAKIFHQEKLIEAWGTGFHRMKESCRQMGLIDPEYFYIKGAFTVRFRKKVTIKANLKSNPKANGKDNLLEFIRQNSGLRINQISKLMEVPSKTIERWVAVLKEQKRIEFRGGKKDGGYFSL